ncbi:hepatic lectin-like [Archocentrus centrarchus]|uniref:hepatic lectin-like n=1 Tax=Archocentrus centrarchus TaxID=63155 RepID=UPI0011EA36B2|nr:hepatic lectin-like [Archocentrus centrarchus]
MPEAEVLYSDVKFTRGNRGVSGEAVSSSPDIIYSEVKLSKTQPATAEPPEGSQQVKSLSRRSKVTWERVGLLVLGALLAAAVAALGVTVSENLRNKEELKKQEELRNEPCDRCEAGWEHHGGKCYHFSISKSSWNQSRAECRAKGGDLVNIDSREEQRFLDGRVRNLMNEAEDKFWIGLTDSAAEGRWMWVDNTPLTESFWLSGEPNNWRGKNPEGENCVRMTEKTSNPDLKSWNDVSCSDPHRSICEKAEIREQIKYVCT